MALALVSKPTMLRGSSSRSRSIKCSATSSPVVSRVQQLAATALVSGALLLGGPALAADGTKFTEPANNASVAGPVHVAMAVQGMAIKPAAEGLVPGTGHFHVLVDTAEQVPEGEAIPFDDTHLHYGKGQAAADLQLAPGKHTLTLQFADALHRSYGEAWRSTITVNVK